MKRAAPGLVGFSWHVLPLHVRLIKERRVVSDKLLQIAEFPHLPVWTLEDPLLRSDMLIGRPELRITQSCGAPLVFALPMDALKIGADLL